jgi:hypothetical protein
MKAGSSAQDFPPMRIGVGDWNPGCAGRHPND